MVLAKAYQNKDFDLCRKWTRCKLQTMQHDKHGPYNMATTTHANHNSNGPTLMYVNNPCCPSFLLCHFRGRVKYQPRPFVDENHDLLCMWTMTLQMDRGCHVIRVMVVILYGSWLSSGSWLSWVVIIMLYGSWLSCYIGRGWYRSWLSCYES